MPNSYACINGETVTLKDGTMIFEENGGGKDGKTIPYGHDFFEIEYDSKLSNLYRLWQTTKDIDYLSDYGVLLILKGNYQKAVETYLQIEKIKPNRYSTASNIGTAYELLGQNENALTWITKAYKINPKSHNSSEWIHVNILEAKIKGEDYINSQFLLNTDFGNNAEPQTKLSNKELLNLRMALYYQLNERVSFIKNEDKIVARLMFDLANLAYLTGKKEHAAAIYDQAKHYGFNEPLWDERSAKAKGVAITKPKVIVQQQTKSKQSNSWLMPGAIVGGSIFILSIIVIRRKRNVV
jgi:tetratricopeptide (TPR) repeat protein